MHPVFVCEFAGMSSVHEEIILWMPTSALTALMLEMQNGFVETMCEICVLILLKMNIKT